VRDFPFEISRADFDAGLALLGITGGGIQSVVVEPRGITVTRLRKDKNGQCFVHNQGVATEVVQISVEPKEQAC
jgi:hypothetical protein